MARPKVPAPGSRLAPAGYRSGDAGGLGRDDKIVPMTNSQRLSPRRSSARGCSPTKGHGAPKRYRADSVGRPSGAPRGVFSKSARRLRTPRLSPRRRGPNHWRRGFQLSGAGTVVPPGPGRHARSLGAVIPLAAGAASVPREQTVCSSSLRREGMRESTAEKVCEDNSAFDYIVIPAKAGTHWGGGCG
jgi:hypothetical protein